MASHIAKFVVQWTTPQLTLPIMVNFQVFIYLDHLNATLIPSHQILRNKIKEHNKDHYWIIPTVEQQLNGGIHKQINSITDHI